VSATIAALEETYSNVDLFEMICQIRGDELNGAGTHELVHRIRGEAIPDEVIIGSFTRRKHKQISTLDLSLPSEWKHLDARQKQSIFGVP
jgi:hypothetical protein